MRLDKFIILILTIFVCALLIYKVTIRQPVSRADFEHQLLALNKSRYARAFSIGKSVQGRDIYAVSITDPSGLGRMQDRVRILIVSGQHAMERTPISAVIDVINDLADTKVPHKRKMLKETVVVIIPVANPDVFDVWGRYNVNGIDMNRDWESRSQPETRAIEKFVSEFKPHIIVDSHEGQPNRVEVPTYGTSRSRTLTMHLAREAASSTKDASLKLNPHYNSLNLSRSLMHRHFASKGICSMLLESPVDVPSSKRRPVYAAFFHKLIDTAAFPPDNAIRRGLTWMMRNSGRPTLDLASKYSKEPERASNSAVQGVSVIIVSLILCLCLNRTCRTRLE